MGRKGTKRRNSFITIAIVLLIIAGITAIAIKISGKTVQEAITDTIGSIYISEYTKEYKMFKDSSKINPELNGIVAFGRKDNRVVGIKTKDIIVDIIEVDPNASYTFAYADYTLYVTQKETGNVKIVPLNKGKYDEVKEFNLNREVKALKVLKNNVYFISDNTLYSVDLTKVNFEAKVEEEPEEEYDEYYYDEEEVETETQVEESIETNIVAGELSYDFLAIEDDVIYFVQNQKLTSQEKEEIKVLAENVVDARYYDYQDNANIIFTTIADGQNAFKNRFNLNTKNVSQMIKNDTYLAPYKDGKSIYLSNDKSLISVIKSNGAGNILYSSKKGIENMTYYPNGYILFEEDGKVVMLNIETKDVETNYIEGLKDLEYLK